MPTYPHPEEEDPEEPPQVTETAAARQADLEDEDSVIPPPMDQGGAERTRRTPETPRCKSAALSERRRGVPDPQGPAEPAAELHGTVPVAGRLRPQGEARSQGEGARLIDLENPITSLEAVANPSRLEAD